MKETLGGLGDPLLFVLGASSACNLLVMWGSRSETVWKAGLSRRTAAQVVENEKLPLQRCCLLAAVPLECEPGQGIGSVPGHTAGESLRGSLYKALGLWAPAPLLR